jgi:hypothetical protein
MIVSGGLVDIVGAVVVAVLLAFVVPRLHG